MRVVEGNLLDAGEDYIVQQCNCLSSTCHGLSRYIADRLPHADVYAKLPPSERVPGTIAVMGDRQNEERPVVCAFSQFGMGKPGSYNNVAFRLGEDSYRSRHDWFRSCLSHIGKDLRPRSVAFPFKIGCGLAGGDWEKDYLPMLKEFDKDNPDTDVVIYRRRGDA
jgi:O-acetyl-ADP-ribose deacetylase (regulator of RNase III)